MKNLLRFRGGSLNQRLLSAVVLILALAFVKVSPGQVTFTQTTDADFLKGHLNNVIVGSNNVTLPFKASDAGTWVTTTVLPQTLAGHRAVSWNDRYAFVVGGFNNLELVNTVYRATISPTGLSAWTTLAPLPVALRDPAVVIGTNTIYVLGGRTDTQVLNTIYYASINPDGSLGAWQTSAVTLPVNLWGHTATYMMGYIYVIGGSSSMTETTAISSVYYSRVNALNTLSAFSAGTSLPLARNRHAAVTYNNKLFVLGGYDNSGTKASTVYIATPALGGSTGAWSTGTALPVAVSNHSAAVSNGMITVMAGAVGATLSNTVYRADADGAPLVWGASPNVMYDYTKDGASFTGNGQVYYTGGTNLSGTPIINCRYANMVTTANYIGKGVFVSNPFYELGALRLITQLAFTGSATLPAKVEVNYRTAGADGNWGSWTALSASSPIVIGLTQQYIQYSVNLTGSAALNATVSDVSIQTPGTQLSGNLNATPTFTSALSPYWVTSDISFTAGTHTFQAGTTLLFLPQTGMSVGNASIICNGTVADSVKFLYFTSETGQWDGIYFDSDSDIGVSSQFYYTVIANAGYGTNNANLYCNQTNEPLLNNCRIRNADGNGVRLNSAHLSIQNSNLKSNTENGLYLASSNPTLVNTSIVTNGGAGVYLTSDASVPNYNSSGTSITGNMYAFRYPGPNFTFYQPNGTPTISGNTYNGIAMDGGDVNGANKRWNSITYDYILLGTVSIAEYAGATRLTIEPGNTVKVVSGAQLRVGGGYPYGGGLYALGTADSLITFTAWNGLAGGWNGIHFTQYSDDWGGQSQLDYCVIEKGNDYNYFSESTNQPNLINNSKIQNALLDGARYLSATGSITNCQFLNNGRYPLYYLNTTADPVHTGNTYTGNVINRIALSGGNYSVNRTLTNDGVAYYVLDNMTISEYTTAPRLTINAGVALEFASGKKLTVGGGYPYSGSLYALGTAASRVVFRAYSSVDGDWEGIHFTQYSDDWGGVSLMDYVTVRHANNQNILIENTSQPTLTNGIIRNSLHDGIVLTGAANPVIQNNSFSNHPGYPLRFSNWDCDPYLSGNTFTSNGMNYISLSGGDYGASRTLRFTGIPYHVLGDIIMSEYTTPVRLTVKPGITMLFDPGTSLQIGGGYPYTGSLYADGTADSLITFKPYNNTAGGWDGIQFTMYSDDWGGTASMKYCIVEKAATANLFCTGTTQPVIRNCTFRNSTGDGLKLAGDANLSIKNSTFTYNTGNGIFLEGTATMSLGDSSNLTCNVYNNGPYEIYNNSTSNVNARYNYFASGDSTMVGFRIYDKSDNSTRGRVNFSPFAGVVSMTTASTVLSGTVKYGNLAATTIKNAPMTVKTFAGATVASTTTNTSGAFSFPSFASGNYQLTISPVAPTPPWSPCNSTDALKVMNHFAMITPLTWMNLAAADVNASHSVNGTDVLHIMKRYTQLITTFPAGESLWTSDTVIVSGSNVTNHILLQYFGDVDATFTPAKKSTGSVAIVHEGSLVVNSFEEFDLPVRLKTGMQVGAISLGFYFPEDYLEVAGAELSDGTTGFSWSSIDGLFRMGWCNTEALNISDDEVVVILKMRSKDISGLTSGIALEIFEDCEFADALAVPANLSVVSVPVINSPLTGVPGADRTAGLSLYPNPVTTAATVRFPMETSGYASIVVTDMVGNQVLQVVSGQYSAGEQRVTLNGAGLKPGIYFLKIEKEVNGNKVSGTIKFVVSL